MSSSVAFGVNNHEPLRRIQQQNEFEQHLPSDMIGEETPLNSVMPSTAEHRFILPSMYVSIPTKEDGYVTLRQQIIGSTMASEQQIVGAKKWHHKAIRRNISKAKELVLFVGGLRCNLPKSRYLSYATQCSKVEKKSSIGPVFPSLGCFFITFLSGTSASTALKLFSVTRFYGKQPQLQLLPYINMPITANDNYDPLLVFVNQKSGGGQGSQLLDMMSGTLNCYQIFTMDKGGALPGLFAFRKLPHFRILICGGDGTVGWVLSHLEVVQHHLVCTNPPIAVLPVGTGNDLARVLGFGSGWSGENVTGVLAQIQDSHPVKLDRWNVMFDSTVDTKVTSPDRVRPLLLSDAVSIKDESTPRSKSGVNIIMNVGGLNGNANPLNHKDGIRILASQTIPNILPDALYTKTEATCSSIESNNDGTSCVNNITEIVESNLVKNDSSGELTTNAGNELHVVADVVRTDDIIDDITTNVTEADLTDDMDDVTSDDVTSDDVTGDDVTNISKTKQSRKSSKHRLVHILSQSDLEYGPFIGFEEGQNEEENDLQLKEKIRLMCLNNENDKDDKSDSSSITETPDGALAEHPVFEALRVPATDVISEEISMDGNEDDAFDDQSNINEMPLSQHPQRHHSISSDTTAIYDKKNVQILPKKKLSLPVTPSYSTVPEKEEVQEPQTGVKMLAMSNYLGMGIDAELTLAFHLAREENPEKCTSRLRNKALYFKAGLKKMTSRSVNLNSVIDLEVDNKKVTLPSIRGLIFLNIGSWAAGAKPWGSGVSKRFDPPAFGDGLLEIFGVGGVAHMSQIYGGLRTGIRIAQGEFIRMTLKAEVAIQVDGEPWMQPPGKIVITASPLQATMLKRNKKKSK